ncbi:hypothetical protein ACPPVO_17735 [Dactylosporangium sp. McL0621]|uniref:hypothetical protein n=1 Tax=Dactylosporangium sp. McL0621 TaxID=3415678 RepID=UPI003CF381A1
MTRRLAFLAAVAAGVVLIMVYRGRAVASAYLTRTLGARLSGDAAGVHDALTARWHTLLAELSVPAAVLLAALLLLAARRAGLRPRAARSCGSCASGRGSGRRS